jgi:hypothetical protein
MAEERKLCSYVRQGTEEHMLTQRREGGKGGRGARGSGRHRPGQVGQPGW